MLPILTVASISKTFDKHQAVRDLSFTVEPGEIFGLLGPNGAGKTTTIRMILDLIKPDTGKIEVFGGPMEERKKNRIGYMPEGAGLYEEMKLKDCLAYLATLKGLTTREASARADAALKRLGLAEHSKKKIEKLSRGMYQKAQLIAATLHDPDLLIVDEPFANLDPINTRLIKDILNEDRARGKSVIMSSHQMHLVEALCDRIALIHQGRAVIYGPVRDVRRQFAGGEVLVAGEGDFAAVPGVVSATQVDGAWRLALADSMTPAELFRALAARSDLAIERFEVALPSLDEIFIRTVGETPYDK